MTFEVLTKKVTLTFQSWQHGFSGRGERWVQNVLGGSEFQQQTVDQYVDDAGWRPWTTCAGDS